MNISTGNLAFNYNYNIPFKSLKTEGSAPVSPDLDFRQKNRYQETKILFDYLKEKGYIGPTKIKTICDFGAGAGGTSLALKEVLNLADENITALEIEDSEAKRIVKSGILPKTSVVSGNGIDFLNRGEKKYDLITACMLGPDWGYNGKTSLTSMFFDVAVKNLNKDGKIIVYSDDLTMKKVKKSCDKYKKENLIDYVWIDRPGLFDSRNTLSYGLDPHIAIITKNPV